MNPFERQMQLGRELMELNAEWFRKIAEFDTQNFQKYVEMNQEFAQKLPEVRDMQSFMDLQREYGESLWNSTQDVVKTRTEMLQEVAQANGEALQSVWSPEATEAPKKSAHKPARKPAAKKAA